MGVAPHRRTGDVHGRVGAVVGAMAVLATLAAGCSLAPDPPKPTHVAEPTVTTTAPADPPTTTAPVKKDPPVGGAHAADIPDAAIMRQLARRAEWIAKRLPPPTPPAGITPGTSRALGYQLMVEFGLPADQWPYLNSLWTRESGWNYLAENRRSGAYGIPQALPAEKMGVVAPDWRNNPDTQIRWGLSYIAARYGNAQRAWAHEERFGWY